MSIMCVCLLLCSISCYSATSSNSVDAALQRPHHTSSPNLVALATSGGQTPLSLPPEEPSSTQQQPALPSRRNKQQAAGLSPNTEGSATTARQQSSSSPSHGESVSKAPPPRPPPPQLTTTTATANASRSTTPLGASASSTHAASAVARATSVRDDSMHVRPRVVTDRRPSQRASAVMELSETPAEAPRAVQSIVTLRNKEHSPTSSPVVLRRYGANGNELQSNRAAGLYQTQQQLQQSAARNDNAQSESSSRSPSARSSIVPAGAATVASAPPVAPKPSLSIEARQSILFGQGASTRGRSDGPGPGPTPPPVAMKPDFIAAARAAANARANAGDARPDADASDAPL